VKRSVIQRGPRAAGEKYVGLSVAMACCVVLAACSSSGASSSQTSGKATSGQLQINLGFPTDLTGGNASGGIEALDSAKLAVSQINASDPSVHVTLKSVDTQSDAGPGVVAVSQLLQDSSLTGIVGMTFTQTAQGAMQLFAKDGRPTIFVQVTSLGSNRPKNVFSMSPPTGPEVTQVVDQVLLPQHIKTVGLIWQVQPTLNNDISVAESELTAHNVKVVASQSTSLTATDFSSQISSVLAAHPDAIGIMAVGAPTGQMVSQIRAEGYKGLLFGQEGDAVPAFAQAAGKSAANFYYGCWWAPGTGPSPGQTFASAFTKQYPSLGLPGAVGLNAYDAVEIFVQAVKKAGSTNPAKVIQELSSVTFQDAMEENPVGFESTGFIQAQPEVVMVSASGVISKVK
jgi:branched-chain amino acid transport system substrate-binding protein